VRVRSSAEESCQPGLDARLDRLTCKAAIGLAETRLYETQAAPQVFEATHGFAQSLQAAQSPESGAAERVAWDVPAKGCVSLTLTLTPAPSPMASTATSTSLMIRPINIRACAVYHDTILGLRAKEARKFRSKFRHLPRQ